MRGTSGHRNGGKFAGWLKNAPEIDARDAVLKHSRRSAFSASSDVRSVHARKADRSSVTLDHHHEIADREREQDAREAYEEAGEEAMGAAGMNTYFTKIYGRDWVDHFGSDIATAYEQWDEWKQRKAEEEGYDYY
jgi:hypothetical protein